MDWLGVKEFIKDSIGYIVSFMLVLLFVVYILSFGQVIGPSMKETLNNGDIVIVNKLVYKINNIKRNDIVAFNYQGSKFLTKRVIGLPGEKISFKDNKIYIDDKVIEEDYIIPSELNNKEYGNIPDDSYFLMGDNRLDSLDSRNFGFVTKDAIIGKVIIRVFPFNKMGIVK